MIKELDIILEECIEINHKRANKKQYLTLKEIVGFVVWEIIRGKEERMALGLRFWQTCAKYGFVPTVEKNHKARIYYNQNYGG